MRLCDADHIVKEVHTQLLVIIVAIMQAWGVCNDRPKLPASGFDYDEETIMRVRDFSFPELFAAYPGCGSAPFVMRNKHKFSKVRCSVYEVNTRALTDI